MQLLLNRPVSVSLSLGNIMYLGGQAIVYNEYHRLGTALHVQFLQEIERQGEIMMSMNKTKFYRVYLRSRHHHQSPNTICEPHHLPNPSAYRKRTARAASWCCWPLLPPRWAWAWTRQSHRNRTRRIHDLCAQPIDTACPGTGSGTRIRAADSPPDASPGREHAPMQPYPDASPSATSRQGRRAQCRSARRIRSSVGPARKEIGRRLVMQNTLPHPL